MKKFIFSLIAMCALLVSASAFAQYDSRYERSGHYNQRSHVYYDNHYNNRADRYVQRSARDWGYYNGAGRYAPPPRYVVQPNYNRGYYYPNERYDRRYNRYDSRYGRCAPNRDRVRDRNQAAIAGAVIGGLVGSQTGGYNDDQAARAAAGALAGAALGYGVGNSSRYDCW